MLSRWFSLSLLVVASFALASCKSTPPATGPKFDGKLERIPLYGSARTPSHSMRPGDYPFDANGNYVSAWAAQGGSYANHPMLSGSHHDDSDPPKPTKARSKGMSGVKKIESSPPKPKAKSTSTASSTKAKPSPTKKPSSRTHTVSGKDTLWGIAKKYGSSVDKIKKANGLTSDILRDGRKLTIP